MLAVMVASCGASEGFLYLVGSDGPSWVASIGSRAAPPEMLDSLAREYIASQAASEVDVTEDVAPDAVNSEWITLGDACYQPMLLSHYSAGTHVVTGLLILRAQPDKMFVRSEFATQISRVAVEIGDCVPAGTTPGDGASLTADGSSDDV
jgi:hypothetical protein